MSRFSTEGAPQYPIEISLLALLVSFSCCLLITSILMLLSVHARIVRM